MVAPELEWLVIFVVGGVAALAALVARGAGRWLALLLASAALAVPVFVSVGVFRFVATLVACLFWLRTVDLVVTPRWQPSAVRRVAHVFSVVDTRDLTPHPRSVPISAIVGAALYGAVAALALVLVATFVTSFHGTEAKLVRWGVGLIAVYSMVDAGSRMTAIGYRAAGFSTPVLHRAPILSRTVGEFWAERWNLTISRYFRRHLFLPLARRRRARLGLCMSFVASAVAHFYIAWAAVGEVGWAAAMGAFFLVQFSVGRRGAGDASPWPSTVAWSRLDG